MFFPKLVKIGLVILSLHWGNEEVELNTKVALHTKDVWLHAESIILFILFSYSDHLMYILIPEMLFTFLMLVLHITQNKYLKKFTKIKYFQNIICQQYSWEPSIVCGVGGRKNV